MTRSAPSLPTKKRHKKILKLAKGYRGRSSTCYRIALQKVENALRDSYKDRRRKKRDFRGLWIQQINAACRSYGYKYSTFMGKVKKMGLEVDRKIISELAQQNISSFKSIIDAAFHAN